MTKFGDFNKSDKNSSQKVLCIKFMNKIYIITAVYLCE